MLGGPNGAGKTTAAKALLRDTLAVTEFVNADTIARGLSGFHPGGSSVAAGRVMLKQLHALAERRIDFAFESTMASRSFAPWLKELGASSYRIHLVFLWLPTPDLAVQRVRERVLAGGRGSSGCRDRTAAGSFGIVVDAPEPCAAPCARPCSATRSSATPSPSGATKVVIVPPEEIPE
jgi:hypothetical protein